MNSSGLGVVTNALVTEDDRGEPAVPYHVLLRAFMDCETISDALVGRAAGSALLVGATTCSPIATAWRSTSRRRPATSRACSCCSPTTGCCSHTNHFRSPAFDRKDVSLWVMPDSPFRLERLRRGGRASVRPISRSTRSARCWPTTRTIPSGICCHPDDRMDPHDQGVDGRLGADGSRRRAHLGRRRTPVHGAVPRARRRLAARQAEPGRGGHAGVTVDLGFGLITCQRYPGDPGRDRELYAEALILAEDAERLGFDSVWTSEHHFVDDGVPALGAAAVRGDRGANAKGARSAPGCCWRRCTSRSGSPRTPRWST